MNGIMAAMQVIHCIECSCGEQTAIYTPQLTSSLQLLQCSVNSSHRSCVNCLHQWASLPWCVKEMLSLCVIGLFGEGPADRRDRLRRILAELSK